MLWSVQLMMHREWLMIRCLMKKTNLGGSTARRGINEESTNNENDIGTCIVNYKQVYIEEKNDCFLLN